MDSLTQKVADSVIACKKKILIPFYGFVQSNSGHQFAKKFGPIISVLIYFSQFVHGLLFVLVFGPQFRAKYSDMEPFTTIFILIGFWLCYKVTYLYYRVSTSKLATPKDILKKQTKKAQQALDPSLKIKSDLVQYYGRDMADILRYSPIAV